MHDALKIWHQYNEDVAAELLLSDRGSFRRHVKVLDPLSHDALYASILQGECTESPHVQSCIIRSLRFLKRYPGPSAYAAERKANTLQAFVGRQQTLMPHNLRTSMEMAARRICGILLQNYTFSPSFEGRHGPGATSERLRGLDKYVCPVPPGFNDPLNRARVSTGVSRTRITSVPKDRKGDRIIGMEPVWNMYSQLALKAKLEWCTRHFIPYTDQSVQHALLRKCETHHLCTIDLSAASDLITESLAYDLLPRAVFDDCAASRTPSYVVPDGFVGQTGSFALMGNGFCFPILSILTLSLVLAACERVFGVSLSTQSQILEFQKRHHVRNYGDDIIAPRSCFDEIQAFLTYAGLSVNYAKSGLNSVWETCGRYKVGSQEPFVCLHVSFNDCLDDVYSATALQNMLYRHGYMRAASEAARLLPDWIDRAAPLTTHPGKNVWVDGAKSKTRLNKDFQRIDTRGLSRRATTRPVQLDGAEWFLACHRGGIPLREEITSEPCLSWHSS